MHNVLETQKYVSKQTRNRGFAASIFAIFIGFSLEFLYKPLTLYRDWCQKHISAKISFSSKMLMWGFDELPSLCDIQ